MPVGRISINDEDRQRKASGCKPPIVSSRGLTGQIPETKRPMSCRGEERSRRLSYAPPRIWRINRAGAARDKEQLGFYIQPHHGDLEQQDAPGCG